MREKCKTNDYYIGLSSIHISVYIELFFRLFIDFAHQFTNPKGTHNLALSAIDLKSGTLVLETLSNKLR